MMVTSCPGFLDQHGVWNNGFDCSSSRVCCGIETDRYCCIPSTSSSSSPTPYQLSDDFLLRTATNILPEKWLLLQICTAGIFLAISLLILVVIYQCLTSIRRGKQQKPFAQVPLSTASPLFLEHNRSKSNRISTISSVLSDGKSRCTDTSMILSTPLNLYPATNSASSTSSSSSSSYYLFPSEFEHLCK